MFSSQMIDFAALVEGGGGGVTSQLQRQSKFHDFKMGTGQDAILIADE